MELLILVFDDLEIFAYFDFLFSLVEIISLTYVISTYNDISIFFGYLFTYLDTLFKRTRVKPYKVANVQIEKLRFII